MPSNRNRRGGVTEYVKATAVFYFEPEHVACQYCHLLETYARNQCRRTGEYIIDPRFTVGDWCPLNFEEPESAREENRP